MKTKKVKSPKDMTAKEYVTTFDIPRTKFHLKNIFEFNYYVKTNTNVSAQSLPNENFIALLKIDISNYLINLLNNTQNNTITQYFFDKNDIEKLIQIYFKSTNIKIKNIKKLNKYIAKFVRKRTNILPNFANNMLLTILNEMIFEFTIFKKQKKIYNK